MLYATKLLLLKAHPHRKIHQLRGVLDLPSKPVLYSTPGKVDMIYSKLQSFLDQDKIQLDEQKRNVLEQSKKAVTDPKAAIDMAQWSSLIGNILSNQCFMRLMMESRFTFGKASSGSSISSA